MNLISIYERPDRHALLYKLLSERGETVSISHKAMPCWGDHVRFVESSPYAGWWFINEDGVGKIVGTAYLTKQNEIGVGIFKEYQGLGYGPQAIKAIIEKHGPRRYLANINPHNEPSKRVFCGLGFKQIQETFALEVV